MNMKDKIQKLEATISKEKRKQAEFRRIVNRLKTMLKKD